MNSVFGLTPSEIEVLECFIEVDHKIACSTESRKSVIDKLNLTTAVVNNHVKALKDKGAIVPTDKRKYSYHPILSFTQDTDKISIKFI